ncbi:hypothetical protein [Lacticaseibacillus salsurivasis]|uniref:hypothetical protein n=1 Tax=Lacticaseibacillus salsurivasis TaxID=3081441 RepID=UPI0030C67097
MSVVAKLMVMCVAALLVTLLLIGAEWRTKRLSWASTGLKGAIAVVVAGVLISLLTVR